jgi:hypothetical protein
MNGCCCCACRGLHGDAPVNLDRYVIYLYIIASQEERIRSFSDLQLGCHYTITYILDCHRLIPHRIRLEPGNISTTLPTRELLLLMRVGLN